MRYLTEQQGLDFASAVDEGQNCYGWLTQLSFAEPLGKRWRLDDVARDVFRQSLDSDDLATIHGSLAAHFAALSESMGSLHRSPADDYKNPDWLELRSEYLYHLLFAGQINFQTPFLTHLLEARYFKASELVGIPFQAITAEFELADHPLLGYQQRQFLKQIRPAVLYGWVALEEYPIDYSFNEKHFNLSKAETDQAVELCLGNIDQFQGLAQVLALCYRSGRCLESQRRHYLLDAYEQAKSLSKIQSLEYWAEFFLYKLGNRLYEIDQFEEAIAAYDAALALKADDHAALYNKGNALGNLGRYEEAIAAYDAALAIKSDDHEALNNKGIALGNLGRYEEAIAAYDAALALKPDDQEALYNKGNALFNLGRYEAAIAAYDAALAIQPDDHAALNNKGFALNELGRYEEAIAAYDAALALKADFPNVLVARGKAYLSLGAIEPAKEDFQRAGEFQPDDPAISMMSTLTGLMGNSGEPVDQSVLATFMQSLSSPELLEQLQANLAQNNQRVSWEQQVQQAEALAKALGLDPTEIQTQLAQYREDPQAQMRDLQVASLLFEANSAFEQGNYETAIAAYDAALAIKPDDPDTWDNRSIALLHLKRADEAIESCKKALEIDPNHAGSTYDMSCSYGLLGDSENACSWLEKAIQLRPDRYREMAKTDTDFDAIRDDPRFQALIEGGE